MWTRSNLSVGKGISSTGETMGLARHRTKPSHLPEQPLVDLNSRTSAEMLKDSPDSKIEIGFPPGPSGSAMAGIRLFDATFKRIA